MPAMPHGQYVFSQLMDHMPSTTFHRCVVRYNGEHKVKHFSCLDQFRCLAFAQLTWRESLRDIEACLNAQASSFTAWDFAPRTSPATQCPTPTQCVIGGFTRISRSI